MQTATAVPTSPFVALGKTIFHLARFVLLSLLFFAILAFSSKIAAAYLPTTPAEPSPFDPLTGGIILSTACTLVIILIIERSRWQGLKLMAALSLTYYGAVTFVTQLEAWYFLYGRTIGPELMLRLFLQGLPVAFVFVPLAAVSLGRGRGPESSQPQLAVVPLKEWIWKLAVIVGAYLVL